MMRARWTAVLCLTGLGQVVASSAADTARQQAASNLRLLTAPAVILPWNQSETVLALQRLPELTGIVGSLPPELVTALRQRQQAPILILARNAVPTLQGVRFAKSLDRSVLAFGDDKVLTYTSLDGRVVITQSRILNVQVRKIVVDTLKSAQQKR